MKKAPAIPLPSMRLRLFRDAISPEMSQEKLADLVGTSGQQIGRLELGQRKLTHEWAERLAPHLGRKPHDFFNEDIAERNDESELSTQLTTGVHTSSNGNKHNVPVTEETHDMHRRTELLRIWDNLDRLGQESLLNAGRAQLALLEKESRVAPGFRERQSS